MARNRPTSSHSRRRNPNSLMQFSQLVFRAIGKNRATTRPNSEPVSVAELPHLSASYFLISQQQPAPRLAQPLLQSHRLPSSLFHQQQYYSGEFILQRISAAISSERRGRSRPVAASSCASSFIFLARRSRLHSTSHPAQDQAERSLAARERAPFAPGSFAAQPHRSPTSAPDQVLYRSAYIVAFPPLGCNICYLKSPFRREVQIVLVSCPPTHIPCQRDACGLCNRGHRGTGVSFLGENLPRSCKDCLARNLCPFTAGRRVVGPLRDRFFGTDLIRLFIRIVLGLIYIIHAEAYQLSVSIWRHAHSLRI